MLEKLEDSELLPIEVPLAQASKMTEHTIGVQHKIAFQLSTSRFFQEPEIKF